MTGQPKTGAERSQPNELRIRINRNSENLGNQSNATNGSKLEPGELSSRKHHQEKLKSITLKSMKQSGLAHQQTSGSKMDHAKKIQTPQKSEHIETNSKHTSAIKKTKLNDLD